MIKLNILNGTAVNGDVHLCRTCVNSFHRVENFKDRYMCGLSPISDDELRGQVTQCRGYHSNMEREAARFFRGQAWLLDMDEKGNLCYRTPAEQQGDDRPRSRTRKHYRRQATVTVRAPRTRVAKETAGKPKKITVQ